jgi:NAD(P)H-quinone oxidoreductase subunit 4
MLSALVWIPIIVALIIAFFPGDWVETRSQSIAFISAIIVVILNVAIGFQFDAMNPEMQLVEYIPWIKGIGLNYHLAVDGLSFPLLCLNSLLTLIAIYSSNKDLLRPRF